MVCSAFFVAVPVATVNISETIVVVVAAAATFVAAVGILLLFCMYSRFRIIGIGFCSQKSPD